MSNLGFLKKKMDTGHYRVYVNTALMLSINIFSKNKVHAVGLKGVVHSQNDIYIIQHTYILPLF